MVSEDSRPSGASAILPNSGLYITAFRPLEPGVFLDDTEAISKMSFLTPRLSLFLVSLPFGLLWLFGLLGGFGMFNLLLNLPTRGLESA